MIDSKSGTPLDASRLGAVPLRAKRRRSRYSAAWVLALCFIGWAILLGIGRILLHLL